MTETPPPAAPRDRDATETRLIAAAGAVLADGGFAAFGVNAVARRAGCDKALIYRYFGGAGGLLAATGAAAAARLAAALAPALEPPPDSYGAMVGRLAAAYAAHLAADPAARALRLMEAADPGAAAPYAAARGAVLADWVVAARGTLAPPPGADAPALNAMVIAAVEGAAILGPAGGVGAERQAAAVAALVAGVYG